MTADKQGTLDLTPNWVGQFETFQQWVNKAASRLDNKAVCIDAIGRRCLRGADFMRARDEKTFPVRYFWDMRAVGTPDPECHYCAGGGERFAHSDDCENNNCSLSHDPGDCLGQMETCPCVPTLKYSNDDVEAIIDGGSADGRRNWLTGAYAKGEITKEQVERFGGGQG